MAIKTFFSSRIMLYILLGTRKDNRYVKISLRELQWKLFYHCVVYDDNSVKRCISKFMAYVILIGEKGYLHFISLKLINLKFFFFRRIKFNFYRKLS